MEIAMCQPNVIVAFGNVSMWALTGKWGIKNWRGSELQTDLELGLDYAPKVIPAYHPAYVLRDWSARMITVQDMKRAKRESETREITRMDYDFVIRPSYSVARYYLDMLLRKVTLRKTKLSVDIETRGGHIACIGIAWSKLAAICIPLMCVESNDGYWNIEEESSLMFMLYQLLTHPNCQVIGQNFIYDAQYFYRWFHYIPRTKQDTMIGHHSVYSNLPKGLDYLHSLYGEHYVWWKSEGKTWDPKTGEEQLWVYNCKDAVNTYEIAEEEDAMVGATGMTEVHDFQQRLFYPVLESMNRGVRVDVKRRAKFAQELLDEMADREAWITGVLGHSINLRSPKQMQGLFYDDLKQKVIINRKTGTPTLNDEALQRIAIREPLLRPLVRRIAEYRSLGVFFSTFVNAPLDSDGRMRCSFNIAGTETYRFSSSENAFGNGLNMQNIPKGGEDDDSDLEMPNVRSLFIPDPDFTFFDIDLDSADLRIVAWESGEEEMKGMVNAGLKVYVEVGKEYFHDPSFSKNHNKYGTFKSFCHGTHYLGQARNLAERTGLLVHEAEKLQRWYFGKFPKVKAWQEDFKKRVSSDRVVSNIFGYKIHAFQRIEDSTFREMIAWLPQSTVACLINRAYVNIYDNLKEVQVLLQVHDSLAGQFPTHLGEWAQKRIQEEARIVLPYDDPCIIPVGIKTSTKSWGDCE
jgi:DNA polymerase I-like protein with 3'-5' exonuclease and polymerase domains